MGNVNPFNNGQGSQQSYTPPPRRVDSEKPLTGTLFDKGKHLKDDKLTTKGWNSVFEYTSEQFDSISSSSDKQIISQADFAKALGKQGVSTEDAKKVYEKISRLDGEDGISKSEMATLNIVLDENKDGEISEEEIGKVKDRVEDGSKKPGIFDIPSRIEAFFKGEKMKEKEVNWEKTEGESVEDPDKTDDKKDE